MDSKKNRRSDTKTRIMDAAEHLFTLNGFRGTTIQQLASDAGVNQAAVNYHFGSKSALIEKVIERRMGPINQQRMQQLEIVRQDAARRSCRPMADDVLRAYIEPVFTLQTKLKGKKYFMALAGRAFFEQDATIRTILINQFTQPFDLFFKIMNEALPELSEDVLLWRLHFSVGAMTHCMRLSSVNLPVLDLFPPLENLKTTTDLLIDFLTNSIGAPNPKQ